MDWLRSEDLKEEKDVTAPAFIVQVPAIKINLYILRETAIPSTFQFSSASRICTSMLSPP